MNVWIIYDSKFGNNKKIAETLGILFSDGNSVHVHHAKEVSAKKAMATNPEILLFGGPLRAGMISFTTKTWVNSFVRMLKSKKFKLQKVGVWGTHGAEDPETPPQFAWSNVQLKWKALMDEVPAEKSMPSVQGISVMGMEGPMEDKWQDLMANFAAQVKSL